MGCLLGFALGDKACGMCRIVASIGGFMEWQPIEAAPKTTKSIMVWCADLRNTYIVSWGHLDEGGNEGWKHFGGGSNRLRETPTHWMPLPPPPKD